MALNRTNQLAENRRKTPINPQDLFANNDEDRKNFLNYDERNRMSEILTNILRHSKSNLSSLEDVFKDFAGRCSIVTRYSLEKVIKNSDLIDAVTADDLDLIFKCYSQSFGLNLRKFNYHNFLGALQILQKQ